MPDELFSADTAREASGPVVTAHGEVDASTAGHLSAALASALHSAGGQPITVDLSDVSFLDSTGLGSLVAAKKAAAAAGSDLRLRSVPPRIMKILQITSLTEIFAID